MAHLLLLPKRRWGWYIATPLLSTWAPLCQPTQTALISTLALWDSHIASCSPTVQVPAQSLGKNLMKGQVTVAQISPTRSSEQGCSGCSSWCGMDLITPGTVLACQHVGFCYSVPLQSPWLSLCLGRIHPQPCLHRKQRAAVCTPTVAVHSTWQANLSIHKT